jgi:hypothetical protein
MKQKRKDKNQLEKEALDDIKEIKTLMNEGKTILDRAVTSQDIDEALTIFNKALTKSTSTNQISQANYLYHMRGLCYFRLKQY